MSIQILREIAGILRSPPSRGAFPFSLLSEQKGIPRGALTEISGHLGSGKSEAVLTLLRENPDVRAAWIESDFNLYPCAFPQRGVQLSRVLFNVTAEEESDLWSVCQIVQSQLFPIVIFSLPAETSEIALRRLQIFAEKSKAAVILLTEQPLKTGGWTLSLRCEASRIFNSTSPNQVRVQLCRK